MLPLVHLKSGLGAPVALHSNVTALSSITMVSLGALVISGLISVIKKKKNRRMGEI